jgi:hypothetical protein
LLAPLAALLLVTASSSALAPEAALEPGPPLAHIKQPISGMAPLGDSAFVLVFDRKADKADERLEVIHLRDGADPLVHTLPLLTGPPQAANDLESIAPVPGTTDRFFVLESGGYNTQRRLFQIQITGNATEGYNSRVEFGPLELKAANLDNVESMLAVAHDAEFQIIVADRSKHDEGAKDARFQLVSFVIPKDLSSATLPVTLTTSVVLPESYTGSWRICSDMTVDFSGNLYVAVALDPDKDDGPFASRIYSVGKLRAGKFVPATKSTEIARLKANKVEALCAQGSTLWLASDDEDLGGSIFRMALPQPVKQ